MRAWFIALVIFGVCLAAIRPWGDYPLNDDWQYARAAKLFVESGNIRIDTPIAPALVGQLLVAYPVVRSLGMSHMHLRAVTWLMSAICLICIDRLLAIAGLRWTSRLFALLVLLLNPLYLYFSNTFMTEIYGYAPALLAAVVYFEYRRRPAWNPVLAWTAVAVLSIFCFWTRQFAAVVFPTIVVTWLLTVARSRNRESTPWGAVVLSCLIFAVGIGAYFWWVRASGNFGFAFGDPLARMARVDFTAWWVETGTAILYLTGFFLPLLVLGSKRWREPLPYIAGALLLLYVLVTRSWFKSNAPSDLEFGGWTHRVFPYITNVIFRTGIGPITLDDVFHDAGMVRPQWPAHTWVLIERIVLVAVVFWGLFVQRAREFWTTSVKKTLSHEVALFSLLWSVVSWAVTVQAYRLEIFDRYYFPLVLSFAILLPIVLETKRHARHSIIEYAGAGLLLSALGWFSIAGLHDHFRWNDARWNLADFAFALGVSPANLAGGFEVNGWKNYDNFQLQQGKMAPNCRVNYDDFFCLDATYRIGMNVIRGYEEIKEEQPSYWLSSGPPVRLIRLAAGQ
ncbi:MAG TPA: hypothetical protein VKY31_01825 [Terriglobia bacterium]|nr:hypothetical protein [Terriglobia bacterium]